MTDGIEQGHARHPVRQGAEGGEQQIDEPERLGRLGDTRGDLVVLDRPRNFGAIELHAPDAEQRQYGYRQHYDPHAPQPLQQLAIEQKRLGQVVQPGEHGRPRGGQAGKRLEEGLGHRHAGHLSQQERQGPDAAQYHPEQHDDEEALLGPEVLLLMTVGKPERGAEQQSDEEGVDELGTTTITIAKCNHRRQQHGRTEQCDQQANDTNDAQNLHSGSLFRPKERWILAI